MSFHSQPSLSKHMRKHKKEDEKNISTQTTRITELELAIKKRDDEDDLKSQVIQLKEDVHRLIKNLEDSDSRFWKIIRGEYFVPLYSESHRNLFDYNMFHQICTLEFKAFPHIVEFLYFNEKYPERQSFTYFENDSGVFVEIYDNKNTRVYEEEGYAFTNKLMDFICDMIGSLFAKWSIIGDIKKINPEDLDGRNFDYWCMNNKLKDLCRQECKTVHVNKLVEAGLSLSKKKLAKRLLTSI